uniref:Reverse transcriptase domain-containing protein n=1 Tax=Tanacetum cinerariifolium TaxID=118510 RepID=A0A699J296_TANCI|nr:reverse transcriptase domain-containing protein [Tanacetum cinerariifolium]
MATNGNGDNQPPPEGGDLPVPDLRAMEELCQPTLNGRGGPIAQIAIQATNFGLKNDMIQQVQNSCQFYGLPGDDANKHLDKFLHVTQSIKVNGVNDDALRLYLFPHFLTHQATDWFDRFPRNSITTFEQMAKIFLEKYFSPSMVTKLRNKITNFRQRPDESLFEAWERYKLSINRCPNHNMLPVTQIDTSYNGLTLRHRDTINAAAGGTFIKSNNITNPKEDLNGIITRSGIAYNGPMIPTTSSPPKVVERETKVTKDTVPPTDNGSTKDVQPLVVQIETQAPNSEPVVAPVVEPVKAPSLLTNKEKLFELSRTPLNMYCSAVLLKKLPEKLGDPGKFLIPCNFSRMDECLALADLGASINLMPLSIWNKLSLPDLSPTCMTLELADRSISRPTGRALIDVYEGELTLRVGNKAVTFNLDQTSRYSSNYDAESINRIDVIDVACEEYSQEVFGFSDEPISPEIDDSYYDSEGEILLLEEFLNDDPSSPPLPPQELKVVEPKNEKSSIDEPPVVELKDLPAHLKYAFLEGDDKLPIIIAKDLKNKEKTALIKVLKSHKQALAWQLSDIKGINPEFCTHKILMEDDFKPAIQHQRMVNPKIHETETSVRSLNSEIAYPGRFPNEVENCRIELKLGTSFEDEKRK